jgi:large subunit ribosomal protein L1
MPKHGKKYNESVKLIEGKKLYQVTDAVAILKKIAFAKFDETVNLDIRLGVDPRQADQQVRGTVALPHGTGKKVRVAVFAKGDKLREAEESGADICGGPDLVQRVLEGFLDFDAAISTPDMMRDVGKLGKVLGPRNLMPNPKAGTVTMDIKGAITALKAGRVEYKLDRLANIHVIVGKMSFSPEQLAENIATVIEAVAKAKPSAAKGTYMKTVSLHSTMSAGIRIEPLVL